MSFFCSSIPSRVHYSSLSCLLRLLLLWQFLRLFLFLMTLAFFQEYRLCIFRMLVNSLIFFLIIRLGLGEEDHRGKIQFSSHQFKVSMVTLEEANCFGTNYVHSKKKTIFSVYIWSTPGPCRLCVGIPEISSGSHSLSGEMNELKVSVINKAHSLAWHKTWAVCCATRL